MVKKLLLGMLIALFISQGETVLAHRQSDPSFEVNSINTKTSQQDLYLENADQISPKEIVDYFAEESGISDDHYSLSYKNLINGNTYHHQADQSYYAASTTKTIIAMLYIDLIDQGLIDYDSAIPYSSVHWQDGGGRITAYPNLHETYSLQMLLMEMIVRSDNTATSILRNYYIEHFGDLTLDAKNLLGLSSLDTEFNLLTNHVSAKHLSLSLDKLMSNPKYESIIQFMKRADADYLMKTYINNHDMAVKYGRLGANLHHQGIYYIDGQPAYSLVIMIHGLSPHQAENFMALVNLNLAINAQKDYHQF